MKQQQCFKTEIGGMPIILTQTGKNRFAVRYWKQLKTGLTYSEAAHELGCCIMHAAACEQTLDNGAAIDNRDAYSNPDRS